MSQARQHELIRRQRRDTLATLAALDARTLWHPLSRKAYGALLVKSLEEHQADLEAIESEGMEEE